MSLKKRWPLTAPWKLSALFWNCVHKFRIWSRCSYYADNCIIEIVRIILVPFRFYNQIMRILSALLKSYFCGFLPCKLWGKKQAVQKGTKCRNLLRSLTLPPIEHFHWRHAVLQHGRRNTQTDLDIQGSHAHHARKWSSCAWTTNREVHGETKMHNNVKRCLHKWILIAVAIEAAMLEDSMASQENALYWLGNKNNSTHM